MNRKIRSARFTALSSDSVSVRPPARWPRIRPYALASGPRVRRRMTRRVREAHQARPEVRGDDTLRLMVDNNRDAAKATAGYLSFERTWNVGSFLDVAWNYRKLATDLYLQCTGPYSNFGAGAIGLTGYHPSVAPYCQFNLTVAYTCHSSVRS